MLITGYYKFARNANSKTKTRVDCIASTKDYAPFEVLRNQRNGTLALYLTENQSRKAKRKGATLALCKTESVTSLFEYERDSSFWYGDTRKTKDCLIILHSNEVFATDGKTLNNDLVIEVFIFRGQKAHMQNLCNLYVDGEFQKEMEFYRGIAKAEEPPTLFD